MSLEDLLRLIEGMIEPNPIGFLSSEKDGFIVTTANTTDLGWETAVHDTFGVWPVQRYSDEESAQEGHQWWLDHVHEGMEVTRLGYLGLVTPGTVRLTVQSGTSPQSPDPACEEFRASPEQEQS